MSDYLITMQKRIIDILDHTLSGDEDIMVSGTAYVDDSFYGDISSYGDIQRRAQEIIATKWFKKEVLRKSYYPCDRRTVQYNVDNYIDEDDGGVSEAEDAWDIFYLINEGDYSKARDNVIEALYYYNASHIVIDYLKRKYPEATKATKKNESAWENNNTLLREDKELCWYFAKVQTELFTLDYKDERRDYLLRVKNFEVPASYIRDIFKEVTKDKGINYVPTSIDWRERSNIYIRNWTDNATISAQGLLKWDSPRHPYDLRPATDEDIEKWERGEGNLLAYVIYMNIYEVDSAVDPLGKGVKLSYDEILDRYDDELNRRIIHY